MTIYINQPNMSCGVREVDGIRNVDPRKFLLAMAHLRFRSPWPENFGCLMYSDVEGKKGAPQVTNYIRRHKLGKVVKTPPFYNPNSSNTIVVWTWVVDQEALREFWREASDDERDEAEEYLDGHLDVEDTW